MTGYGQFCAVARAVEILGERWTLLVVRELLMGARTFGDIRGGLPRIPTATLAARLRRLQATGLVAAVDGGYAVTDQGRALAPAVRELARWATKADAAALRPDDLDPAALTWDIRRRVDRAALPERPVVVAIEFTDRPAHDRRFWLHLSHRQVDLCRDDTGAEVEVWLAGPTADLTRWWLGELSWSQLIRRDGVRVHGDRALRRQLPTWFLRYVFTPAALAET